MKKIVIFSSSGGGGHISAATAIDQYLNKDYIVNTVYIFDEVIGRLDPFKTVTLGGVRCEQFYNFLLRKKWTGCVNALYKGGRLAFRFDPGLIKYIVKNYLKKTKPDLVISVVPLVNELLKRCCQELDIPFLLVPTDLNPDPFIYNITNPVKSTMQVAVSFNDSDILDIFNSKELNKDYVNVTDFPIKPSFFEPKDCVSIKQEFNVPQDKKVIMVLMGAAGSDVTHKYVKTLSKLDFPVHLLICLGRNEQLREKIESIQLPAHISCTIIGLTERIADLMAISDLCITKAGSVSVCETIYMNLPMILDNTSIPLSWEAFNLSFVNKHQFGRVSNNFRHLNYLVKSILKNPSYYSYLKTNLETYPKAFFGTRIKTLVSKMLESQSQQSI